VTENPNSIYYNY